MGGEGEGSEARERFERAFSDAPIGMALAGLDGRFLRVNASLCEMLGLEARVLLAKTFQDITHPEDLDADLAHVGRLVDGEIPGYSLEKRYRSAGGRWIWTLLSVSLVRDAEGRPAYFISQVVDISERKRAEDRLADLADHDSLTGLVNRRRFGIDLSRAVTAARRGGAPALLVLCDVDDFKYVNDTFGHHAGDTLIAHVGRTLAGELDGPIVARLSGDELAVLVPGVRPEEATRPRHDLGGRGDGRHAHRVGRGRDGRRRRRDVRREAARAEPGGRLGAARDRARAGRGGAHVVPAPAPGGRGRRIHPARPARGRPSHR